MLLTPGTRYTLDGIAHQVPITERIIGPPVLWNDKKVAFFTQLKQLLAYFHNVCELHNIRYYISCGTLLGAVKMKGFLPSDTDGDVSIPSTEVLKLKAAFSRGPYPFIPFRYGYKLCVPNFPHYPFLDLMIVDLDPRYSEPTYSFSYPLDEEGNPTFELRLFFSKKKHPASTIFPLRKYEFEGMELWGPANGEEVCRLNYGEECFNTSFVKPCRKHYVSGFTAVWGHRLCQVLRTF